MSTRGKSGAKALAVIKGQLSATETRLYEICQDFGEVELKGTSNSGDDMNKIGHYVMALALQLESYRETIDAFTDRFRETFDLPPVQIRRDTYCLRKRVMELALENPDQYPPEVRESAKNYIQSLRRSD